jgi:hypothetical protein
VFIQRNLFSQVVQQVDNRVLGIVGIPRLDDSDLEPYVKVPLENARGIGDTPFYLQAPISFFPKFFVGHDFEFYDPDRPIPRQSGRRKEKNGQKNDKQLAARIKKPTRISHRLIIPNKIITQKNTGKCLCRDLGSAR